MPWWHYKNCSWVSRGLQVSVAGLAWACSLVPASAWHKLLRKCPQIWRSHNIHSINSWGTLHSWCCPWGVSSSESLSSWVEARPPSHGNADWRPEQGFLTSQASVYSGPVSLRNRDWRRMPLKRLGNKPANFSSLQPPHCTLCKAWIHGNFQARNTSESTSSKCGHATLH